MRQVKKVGHWEGTAEASNIIISDITRGDGAFGEVSQGDSRRVDLERGGSRNGGRELGTGNGEGQMEGLARLAWRAGLPEEGFIEP